MKTQRLTVLEKVGFGSGDAAVNVVWSALAGAVYLAARRFPRGAWLVAGLVFSHWLLDLVTHRPDLPIGVGTEIFVGLGLWNSVVGTVVAEAGLFGLGIFLYARATRAVDRVGSFGFWGLIVFLTGIYVANVAGPPPPNSSVIAVAGNASWLFVIWAYWVDRHRLSILTPRLDVYEARRVYR